MAQKLKDPIGDDVKENEEVVKGFDDLPEFGAVSEGAASAPHPFQGFPMGKDKLIKVGEHNGEPLMVLSTYVVGIDPSARLRPQDKSGKNQTIREVKTVMNKDGLPTNRYTGKTNIATIVNRHSEVVRNYEEGGGNMEIVFDRVTETKSGPRFCAIVPSHSARAQLIFKLDQISGRVKVDHRYVLADLDQESRLRQLFLLLNGNRLKEIRLAGEIVGSGQEA